MSSSRVVAGARHARRGRSGWTRNGCRRSGGAGRFGCRSLSSTTGCSGCAGVAAGRTTCPGARVQAVTGPGADSGTASRANVAMIRCASPLGARSNRGSGGRCCGSGGGWSCARGSRGCGRGCGCGAITIRCASAARLHAVLVTGANALSGAVLKLPYVSGVGCRCHQERYGRDAASGQRLQARFCHVGLPRIKQNWYLFRCCRWATAAALGPAKEQIARAATIRAPKTVAGFA